MPSLRVRHSLGDGGTGQSMKGNVLDDLIRERIQRARKHLAGLEADTLMVLSDENRFYLSGFSGLDGGYNESAGVLLITQERLVLATDGRYNVQAETEAPLYEVVCYPAGLARVLPDLVADLGTRRLGFEAGRMPHADYLRLSKALEDKGLNVLFTDAAPVLDRLRVQKEPSEIDAIRRALAFAENAFELFINYDLSPGMTEKEAAWVLERRMREMGADGLSFPIIAAFGENSALPHAVCGDRVAQPGMPLLFDWGGRAGGYCSDTTRSFVLGKADSDYRKVHQAVYDAHMKAVEAIQPGVSAKAVDAAARDHIDRAGFGEKFAHGLGHGVGLAIHEPPRVSAQSDDVLEEGMVVTVEPGIYLPGWGGVRLENMAVVRSRGAEVLNRLPLTHTEPGGQSS